MKKIICPYCQIEIKFSEVERKWNKSKNGYIRKKCKCGKIIGITQDIRGDLVAYKFNN